MKDKKEKIKNNKCGMVLVIAVVIIVVLAIIGIGLLQLGKNARLQGVKDVLQISSRSAADAGIEHAVRYMIDSWKAATNKSVWIAGWNDTTVWTDPAVPATPVGCPPVGPVSLSGTFGGATFTYNIYKGTRPTGYWIFSTGTAAGVTRTVHAAVILKSFFDYELRRAIAAKNSIDVYPNTDFGTVPADSNFTIQTNSTAPDAIKLKPNITVPGDVVVGPGGDPDIAIDLAKNSVIEGEDVAAEDYMSFPPIYRPTGFPVGTPTTVGSNLYIYGNIQINGGFSTNKTVYIGDPADPNKGLIRVYVNGTTNLNSGANLIVNAGYSLELYLGGNTKIWPGSTISYTTTPHTTDAQIIDAAGRIAIKGTTNQATGIPDCTSVIFQPNGNFYGTIYVPDAALTMQPGGSFYGAIPGANSIILRPGQAFVSTFPSSYILTPYEDLYMGVKMGSWWEE